MPSSARLEDEGTANLATSETTHPTVRCHMSGDFNHQQHYSKKMDKWAKDKLVRSLGENGGGYDAQKDFHSRTGRDEMKGKTQEMMERGNRKEIFKC